jgi:hypothetical protein
MNLGCLAKRKADRLQKIVLVPVDRISAFTQDYLVQPPATAVSIITRANSAGGSCPRLWPAKPQPSINYDSGSRR